MKLRLRVKEIAEQKGMSMGTGMVRVNGWPMRFQLGQLTDGFKQIIPVLFDQVPIDRLTRQTIQHAVVSRGIHAPEARLAHIGQPGTELIAHSAVLVPRSGNQRAYCIPRLSIYQAEFFLLTNEEQSQR